MQNIFLLVFGLSVALQCRLGQFVNFTFGKCLCGKRKWPLALALCFNVYSCSCTALLCQRLL